MNDYITDDLHLVPRYPGVTLLNVHGDGTTTYAYNDLGDRLQETVNGVTTTFTMDLASGLTQVLDDGTNTYLYGWPHCTGKRDTWHWNT